LLVFINDKTRTYQDLADMEKIRSEIESDLRDQCHLARKNIEVKTKEFDEWIKKTQTAWQNRYALGLGTDGDQGIFANVSGYDVNFQKAFYDPGYRSILLFLPSTWKKCARKSGCLIFYQQEILPRMNPTMR